MKILFIGGTGNISAECARVLFEGGSEISVLTRGLAPVPSGYKRVRADYKDVAAVREALGNHEYDVVANFIGFDVPDLERDASVFEGRAGQYIFISSATVYSKPPQKLPITEYAPRSNPWWDYARKKIACEQWLEARRGASGLPYTVVRPSHTYSHAWTPNPISSSSYTFCSRMEQGLPLYVHDDGQTPWTLTTSTDFANAFACLCGNSAAIGEAFHITSDEVLTWNEIYEITAEALGVPLPKVHRIPTDFICDCAPRFIGTLKGDKAHPGIFDCTKVKRLAPGWKCRKDFREGIRESLEWLRAHPEKKTVSADLNDAVESIIGRWTRSRQAG